MAFCYGATILKDYSSFRKKPMRIISLQKYNAHTEPLFKTLQLLKVNDICPAT